MFDLEKAIADWREEMLAAGVKSPVPLEELESHLREEIEEQSRKGMERSEAFQKAVKNVGPPKALKAEFARGTGIRDWYGGDGPIPINQVFGTIWLSLGLWFFLTRLLMVSRALEHDGLRCLGSIPIFIVAILFLAMQVVGGICLMRWKSRRQNTIRFLAMICSIILVKEFGMLDFDWWFYASAVLVVLILCAMRFWQELMANYFMIFPMAYAAICLFGLLTNELTELVPIFKPRAGENKQRFSGAAGRFG